jgi:hypothetical protein
LESKSPAFETITSVVGVGPISVDGRDSKAPAWRVQAVNAGIAAVLVATWLAIAYMVWPTGITSLSIGAIALGAGLKTIASSAMALGVAHLGSRLWVD